MLLWCLQDVGTVLIGASYNGHIQIVKHLVVHKADVNAKNDVITALIDGWFDSLIVLIFCDAAVVSAVRQHRASNGSKEKSQIHC